MRVRRRSLGVDREFMRFRREEVGYSSPTINERMAIVDRGVRSGRVATFGWMRVRGNGRNGAGQPLWSAHGSPSVPGQQAVVSQWRSTSCASPAARQGLRVRLAVARPGVPLRCLRLPGLVRPARSSGGNPGCCYLSECSGVTGVTTERTWWSGPVTAQDDQSVILRARPRPEKCWVSVQMRVPDRIRAGEHRCPAAPRMAPGLSRSAG